MTGAETDLDLGHYERFKVQRLMPARVVEAIGDQTAHALAPHVGEVHWRAGFVLALGHGGARQKCQAAGARATKSDRPVAATFWDDDHCRHPA
jgi:hypothetical protein